MISSCSKVSTTAEIGNTWCRKERKRQIDTQVASRVQFIRQERKNRHYYCDGSLMNFCKLFVCVQSGLNLFRMNLLKFTVYFSPVLSTGLRAE